MGACALVVPACAGNRTVRARHIEVELSPVLRDRRLGTVHQDRIGREGSAGRISRPTLERKPLTRILGKVLIRDGCVDGRARGIPTAAACTGHRGRDIQIIFRGERRFEGDRGGEVNDMRRGTAVAPLLELISRTGSARLLGRNGNRVIRVAREPESGRRRIGGPVHREGGAGRRGRDAHRFLFRERRGEDESGGRTDRVCGRSAVAPREPDVTHVRGQVLGCRRLYLVNRAVIPPEGGRRGVRHRVDQHAEPEPNRTEGHAALILLRERRGDRRIINADDDRMGNSPPVAPVGPDVARRRPERDGGRDAHRVR